MKTIGKKLSAGLILGAFVVANVAAVATQEMKPDLREIPRETSLPLRGEVSITTKNSPVSLSLRQSDVSQVLRMFADKAGLNIILHPQVQGQTVTLDLVKVPLNKAFEMVMEITSLTYVLDGNTIIIAPTSVKNFNVAKQDMTSIPVKYVDAATIAEFLNKNIYGIDKPGISGGEIAVTNPSTNELLIFGGKNEVAMARKVVDKFDKQPTNTVFKVNHTTPAQMADMICNNLLPSALGQSAGGAASGGGAGGGSGLSVNEGTIACTYGTQANAGALSSIGMPSLSVSYYASQGTLNVLGGSPQQLEMIKDFIAKTDKKHPQAYLEVSIIELSESGSKELNNSWTINSRYFSANFDGEGNTKANDVFRTNDSLPSMPKIFNANPNITYAISYLIENRKGRVVANPRILVTNGQASTIDLTSDYIKSTTSQVIQGLTGNSAIQKTYEIGDDNGIKVDITPFISPDGYVTLDITPDYATIKQQVYSSNEDAEAGKDLQATLLQRRSLDLKGVRIKDGETLVIGGMINENEIKNVSKIPVLGDLPIIGSIFRSSQTTKSKEEMIIMITPKIITDDEDVMVKREAL